MSAESAASASSTLNKALFGFGDAVCVPVIEWIARNCLNPVWDEMHASQEIKAAPAKPR